ncbi:hypothetical protein J5N97_025572 [Dioscorea zingiberensis]|uniref:SHSP domain-containing protein n=1 Tax=Dioscorea zingiberensis TaxID=325984 RepID=A0A9D5HA07_9LILI|nr:hypothetical protein J5N97_025572 [Dioscorea zingiberensis]
MLRSAREHPQVVYEEFDPPSEWVHEEKGDIVLMDVSGFKKDELKVFLESDGKISVSGERPIEEDKRWIRFRKELSQPENCKANEIKAKFDCGILYIIMPKHRQQEDEPPKTTTTTTTTTTTQETEAEAEAEAEPSQNDAKKMESQANSNNSSPRGKQEGSSSSNVVARHAIARGGLSSNLKHLMLILVVVILVLGLGRRIKEEVFKLKSS